MPDYAKLYATLFRSQTKAINILVEAQQETENMYIESEPPDIRVLHTERDGKDDEKDED